MVDPEQKSAWDDPLGARIIVGRVVNQIGSQVPEVKRTIVVFRGSNILFFCVPEDNKSDDRFPMYMIRFCFFLDPDPVIFSVQGAFPSISMMSILDPNPQDA